MLKRIMHNINLWWEYNDTYIDMHKKHKVNRVTASTEGYKFMERGWWIVLLILLGLSLLNHVL